MRHAQNGYAGTLADVHTHQLVQTYTVQARYAGMLADVHAHQLAHTYARAG